MVKNTMNLINKCHNVLNVKYDMTCRNMEDISNHSKNKFDLITNSFYFGYMQGMKATKKEFSEKKYVKGGAR